MFKVRAPFYMSVFHPTRTGWYFYRLRALQELRRGCAQYPLVQQEGFLKDCVTGVLKHSSKLNRPY